MMMSVNMLGDDKNTKFEATMCPKTFLMTLRISTPSTQGKDADSLDLVMSCEQYHAMKEFFKETPNGS